MIQAISGTSWSGGDCGLVYDYGPASDPNLCAQSVLFTSMHTIVADIPGAVLRTR